MPNQPHQVSLNDADASLNDADASLDDTARDVQQPMQQMADAVCALEDERSTAGPPAASLPGLWSGEALLLHMGFYEEA